MRLEIDDLSTILKLVELAPQSRCWIGCGIPRHQVLAKEFSCTLQVQILILWLGVPMLLAIVAVEGHVSLWVLGLLGCVDELQNL